MPGRLKRGARLSSVAFCDMSGGVSDASALAVAHSETVEGTSHVLLDHLEVVDAPHEPARVAEQFAKTLHGFGLKRVTGDRYSAGWVVGAFEKHGIAYEPSDLDKSAIYAEVLPLFSERRVELPDDRRLLTELRLLERKARGGGRPDSVDHPPRAHDDAANAAAGALWLAAKESTTLERPGAYIKARQLLTSARAEGAPEPVPMPDFLDGSFACIAGGIGADPDSIGAVFLGISVSNPAVPPLVILDWTIEELGAYPFETFLDAIAMRLQELAATDQVERGKNCRFIGSMTGFRIGGVLFEPDGVGAVLEQQAKFCGRYDVMKLSEPALAGGLAQRILDAGAHVNGGHVGIVAPAFDQRHEHQGVSKNHLLSQLTAVAADAKQAPGCLLAAFATGCSEAFVARQLLARTL